MFEGDGGRSFQPRGFLVAIRDSPSLLIEALRYPWKDDTGASTTPDDEATKILAKKVGGLLHKLTELPGQSELCPINGKSFADWVVEVIRIASEQRYLTAVGLQLPNAIASGAWNAIDEWPTTDVAEAINVLAKAIPETFPRHLAISLSNARGVHCCDDTGESEKAQAEAFRNRADQLQQICPCASRALRHVAQDLDSEASRNVEEAEWRQ